MATRIPTMYGRYYVISFIWRGRQMTFTAYRASLSRMQRPQAQKLCDKMYPGCRVISFHESDATDGPVVLTTESKDCGDGMYYCNDDQKCKPIPKGYKEREDGYLVKEEAPKGAKYERMVKHIKKSYAKDGKLTDDEKSIAYATAWKQKNKMKNETYFYAGDSKEEFKDKAKKKKENEMKVKKEDTVVLTKAADEKKKKKKKENGTEGATDVPNFPQDQVSEDWQKKSGKSPSGGLNEKGRKSYERQNPGSDLKAPVTGKVKKGGKAAGRRKSFCARMRGMKKRLTSAKTARDPDSRINKSLRKWKC